MSKVRVAPAEVEAYLAGVAEPGQGTLRRLRAMLLEVVPEDAVECMSYGVPAFRTTQSIAGNAAAKKHGSYYPMSGRVISRLASELAGYETTKGAIHFGWEKGLPRELVERLVAERVGEMGVGKKKSSSRDQVTGPS